jgi:hypothetical protein
MGRDTDVRNNLTDKGNHLRDSHDSPCARRNVPYDEVNHLLN